MRMSLRRRRRQDAGATVEYGLIAVMLCAAIIAAVFALRSAVAVTDQGATPVVLVTDSGTR